MADVGFACFKGDDFFEAGNESVVQRIVLCAFLDKYTDNGKLSFVIFVYEVSFKWEAFAIDRVFAGIVKMKVEQVVALIAHGNEIGGAGLWCYVDDLVLVFKCPVRDKSLVGDCWLSCFFYSIFLLLCICHTGRRFFLQRF